MTHINTQQLMTVSEAAGWLRCSPDCVYDAIRREEIRAIRVGRLIRIPQSELLKLGVSPLDRSVSSAATGDRNRIAFEHVPTQPCNQELQP